MACVAGVYEWWAGVTVHLSDGTDVNCGELEL